LLAFVNHYSPFLPETNTYLSINYFLSFSGLRKRLKVERRTNAQLNTRVRTSLDEVSVITLGTLGSGFFCFVCLLRNYLPMLSSTLFEENTARAHIAG
jgi:hypothetical protein